MKWDVWWRSVQDNVSARLLRSLYLSIVLPSVFSRDGCSIMLRDLKVLSCLSLRFSSNPLCPEVLFLAPGITPRHPRSWAAAPPACLRRLLGRRSVSARARRHAKGPGDKRAGTWFTTGGGERNDGRRGRKRQRGKTKKEIRETTGIERTQVERQQTVHVWAWVPFKCQKSHKFSC